MFKNNKNGKNILLILDTILGTKTYPKNKNINEITEYNVKISNELIPTYLIEKAG
jgi:hypothetical protein